MDTNILFTCYMQCVTGFVVWINSFRKQTHINVCLSTSLSLSLTGFARSVDWFSPFRKSADWQIQLFSSLCEVRCIFKTTGIVQQQQKKKNTENYFSHTIVFAWIWGYLHAQLPPIKKFHRHKSLLRSIEAVAVCHNSYYQYFIYVERNLIYARGFLFST